MAARGLDVKQLILVVNYDCPNHYEDYVHRCGRTGRAGNSGTAYTFLTPEQGRYAGEIIRALELSSATVPDDLRHLWDTYKTQQEAEGKKVHTGGGFSGKGFKFDEQEAAAVKENKKMQKVALGMQDSDDDEDLENDIDQQIESMFAAKRNVKEIEAPLIVGGNANSAAASAAQAAAVITANLAANTSAAAATPTPGAGGQQTEKLELAKRLASRINMAKNLGFEAKGATQQAAEAILKGGPTQSLITVSFNAMQYHYFQTFLTRTPRLPFLHHQQAKTVAEQLAAKLNNKLNYQPKEDDDALIVPGADSLFKKYEEELEINDFPQQARWKVTSKVSSTQCTKFSLISERT